MSENIKDTLAENAFRELKEDEEYVPLMPNGTNPREVTVWSVCWGILMAVIFSAAAAYLGLKVGQVVASGKGVAPEVGNALPLSEIPVGTLVHNIELRPGQGAAMARSAGTFAQLAAREGNHAVLRLPSGETRMVLVSCRATVGTVSNPDHNLESYGKAGRSRWLGRRPHNRGVVMNPHDHPMGGGEGRASGGHPRSRKGLPAKGYKTRNPKASSNKFIIERRKK